MKKNKLDAITFSKIYDMFGEKAARDTLNDANEGKIGASTLEKYLFTDESKSEYAERLREEYKNFE